MLSCEWFYVTQTVGFPDSFESSSAGFRNLEQETFNFPVNLGCF